MLRRAPWLCAFATLLLVPARVPVTIGSTEANLLVPLYAVVGAAAVALALDLLRGDKRVRELGLASWPLAAFLAWTGISLSWATDIKQGSVELLFFYIPFGLLAVSLARLPWRARMFPLLAGQLGAMALLFSLVGIYQEVARDIFWNPKVIVGNAYQSFFRVNSLFWDPSIYGRFLVVAILAGLTVVLWTQSMRLWWIVVFGMALAWVGLLFSYSQTSFASLLAGAIVAVGLRVRGLARRAVPVTAVLLLGGALLALHPAPSRAVSLPAPVVADATSGRGKLIREGIKIALHHPVGGVGIGGFRHAYANRVGLTGANPRVASHTTPVTVAAETGIVGFALLAWLAIVVLVIPFRNVSRTVAGQASLVLGLVLVAIGVHSIGYNALFEDPMAWGALGLAVVAARGREEEAAQ